MPQMILWRRALARHVTLLGTFSVLSAVLLTLIAVLLAWQVQGVVEGIALKQEATLAEGQAQALLRADLLPHSPAVRLTPQTLRQLVAFTRRNMHYGLFVRVKIWSPSGTVLYSDAPAAIGRRFPIDDELGDILAGTRASAAGISDLNAAGRARRSMESECCCVGAANWPRGLPTPFRCAIARAAWSEPVGRSVPRCQV